VINRMVGGGGFEVEPVEEGVRRGGRVDGRVDGRKETIWLDGLIVLFPHGCSMYICKPSTASATSLPHTPHSPTRHSSPFFPVSQLSFPSSSLAKVEM